jgi:tetratricopeptide (TPR) repeat protein
MSLKSERELSSNSRSQYTRAKTAAQSKNYDYAITLMLALLKDEPLFFEGRRFLRAVEIQKYKGLNTFTRQMNNMKVGSAVVKLSAGGKKEPLEQFLQAEEVLSLDPFQTKANAMIGDAGEALGYLDFRAFAFETMAEGRPKDKALLNALAETYMAMGDASRAEKTYERILTDIDPRDGDALSGLKNASAAHASKSGGWETASSYRDVIKDKTEAEQLEQQSKVVKSTDAIAEQIQINFKKHEAEPNNPAHSKAIAQLYVQKSDFGSAIPWYEHAFEAGGKIDSALEKSIGDLRLKKVEQELQAARAALAQAATPEEQAQNQAAIDEKEKELNEVRLFQAETRVRAQPNDGEFRYDLGLALYKMGQYKRATEELQLSLKQPSVRYNALNMMGQSFAKRGMYDFAIKQLALAESELPVMDELKKEIVYNLGIVYETTKKPDKALEQWKKIYDVDMSYRDVGRRVEDSYEQGGDSPAPA